MKRSMLLLLFSVLLVGCVPIIYVTFDNVTSLTFDKCWIKIFSYNANIQPTFYTDPGGSVVPVAEVMALDPEITDESDYIIINAYFNVRRYAVADDGYWFEVNVVGSRYIRVGILNELPESSRSLFQSFPFFIDILYEEAGYISTGTYWVPEDRVTDMSVLGGDISELLDIPCISDPEDDESMQEALPQAFYCSITPPKPSGFEVNFRVGPGTHRSVRYVAIEPFDYSVYGYTFFNDVRWLQVATNYGQLWVNESPRNNRWEL